MPPVHGQVRAQQTFLPSSSRDVGGGLYGEGAFPTAMHTLGTCIASNSKLGLPVAAPAPEAGSAPAGLSQHPGEHQRAKKARGASVDPLRLYLQSYPRQAGKQGLQPQLHTITASTQTKQRAAEQPDPRDRGWRGLSLQPEPLTQEGAVHGQLCEAGKSRIIVNDRERQGKGKEQV